MIGKAPPRSLLSVALHHTCSKYPAAAGMKIFVGESSIEPGKCWVHVHHQRYSSLLVDKEDLVLEDTDSVAKVLQEFEAWCAALQAESDLKS